MELKRTWQDNGTKIIGWVTTALGTIGLLDSATVQGFASLLGPKYGPRIPLIFLVLTGVGTALRGHKNTANIAAKMVSQASVGEVQASAKVVTDVAKTAVAADDAAAATHPTPSTPSDGAKS